MSAPDSVLETCHRLVGLVEAQAASLEAGDFVRFTLLLEQRAALQAQLADLPVETVDDHSRAVLREVAALDRSTLERARYLLDAAAAEVRQLHRRRDVLGAYAQPGLHLRQQPALLDQPG